MRRITAAIAVLALSAAAGAAEWHVAPDGRADGKGSEASPWDIASTLAGRRGVRPGDTVWLAAGTYKDPNRKHASLGFTVKLTGEKARPIHVRARPGERVTIDGGLAVQAPSAYLWIRDLEIVVSENFTLSRTINEPGSHPRSLNRPWGGLSIYAGTGCRFIDLVIHDNAQGISWWKGSTDSEVYGCVIYGNGWKAPDRGHGHAIYTQNKDGLKTIRDCIMTGGYSYTMHAYGSSRAWVDNYRIEGNIAYAGGPFLVGGGRPSRNIRVLSNVLHGVSMRIGYSAAHNENCEVRDNTIVNGRLSIVRYRKVTREGNLVLAANAPRPEGEAARVVVRPNKYDPNRAHVAVFNWRKNATVAVRVGEFLKSGQEYRLMDPRKLYGKPVAAGEYDGKAVRVPAAGEFAAFVLLKGPRQRQ